MSSPDESMASPHENVERDVNIISGKDLFASELLLLVKSEQIMLTQVHLRYQEMYKKPLNYKPFGTKFKDVVDMLPGLEVVGRHPTSMLQAYGSADRQADRQADMRAEQRLADQMRRMHVDKDTFAMRSFVNDLVSLLCGGPMLMSIVPGRFAKKFGRALNYKQFGVKKLKDAVEKSNKKFPVPKLEIGGNPAELREVEVADTPAEALLTPTRARMPEGNTWIPIDFDEDSWNRNIEVRKRARARARHPSSAYNSSWKASASQRKATQRKRCSKRAVRNALFETRCSKRAVRNALFETRCSYTPPHPPSSSSSVSSSSKPPSISRTPPSRTPPSRTHRPHPRPITSSDRPLYWASSTGFSLAYLTT